MNDYESVNNEIQSFLSKKRSPGTTESRSETTTEHNIIPLLRSLCTLYNEINTYLRSGNADALKDVILKSDVKMSLVCETLLETLKMTAEEKNRLCEENHRLDSIRRDSEEIIAKQKIEIAKWKEETKTRENNLNEVNRVLKDQKEKMKEMRKEVNEMKDMVAHEKIKNEELVNLKAKAYERMGVYEKEMEGMKCIYMENEEKMKRIIRENKEEEDNSSGMKVKIVEYGKKIEMLEKRMETKERNLMLCNNELSKMIEENKVLKEENEKHKGGSEYYERLYKGVNKQNEYLNRQLSRILEAESYNKDGMVVIKKYIEKIKKQKKRIMKLKKEKRKMEEELNEEKKKVNEKMGEGDETFLTGVTLESRIEELVEENKGYLEKIKNLEREKKEIENKIEFFKTRNKEEKGEMKSIRNEYNKKESMKSAQNKESMKNDQICDKYSKDMFYNQNGMHNKHSIYDKKRIYNKDMGYKNGMHNKDDANKDISYKNEIYKKDDDRNSANKDIAKNNLYGNYDRNRLTQNYRNEYIFGKKDELINKYGKFDELFSSPPHAAPLMTELRKHNDFKNIQYVKPNLYNDYEKDKIQIGGFQDDVQLSGFKEDAPVRRLRENAENDMFRLLDKKKDTVSFGNKEIDSRKNGMAEAIFETRQDEPIIFGQGTSKQQTELTSKADRLAFETRRDEPTIFGKGTSNKHTELASKADKLSMVPTYKGFEDENSTDSLKTYHTTSTLKEMIDRTDNLQKKFEDLEEQLANIKEDNSEQKLENKLKTYNSHFSELNIDSNDSDFF